MFAIPHAENSNRNNAECTSTFQKIPARQRPDNSIFGFASFSVFCKLPDRYKFKTHFFVVVSGVLNGIPGVELLEQNQSLKTK
jgi:hypothetical protein